MKPRSAPENGAFVPPSSSRIAGTEPAPMKTSSAVPIASANARCATENGSITHLLPALGQQVPGPFRGFNERRRSRTTFDIVERRSGNVRHRPRLCQGIPHEYLRAPTHRLAGTGVVVPELARRDGDVRGEDVGLLPARRRRAPPAEDEVPRRQRRDP